MSFYQQSDVRTYNVQKTMKFPVISIEIAFSQVQNPNDIEARNLVSRILPQVLADFPSKIATKSYFSDLYAAKIYTGVKRNGDRHEVTFQFLFTDPSVIVDPDYNLKEIINCIKRVLLAPAIENNQFIDKIFTVENRIMQSKITNMYDDKMTYAQLQLLEYMFAGTPFALRPYGKVENYQKLSNPFVYQTYQKMLLEDSLTISIVGNVEQTLIIEELNQVFTNLQAESKKLLHNPFVSEKLEEVVEYVEKQAINQTKLHIGYRMPVTINSQAYFIHKLALEILGGGAQSKLFQNVREKASLAYYVSASMDLYAGAFYVYAGIDHENIEQAQQIINEQIEAICNGEISAEELRMAKNNMLHRSSMMQDSPWGMITLEKQFAEFQQVKTLEELEEAISEVTIVDIVEAANTWKEDTVFILTTDGQEDVK